MSHVNSQPTEPLDVLGYVLGYMSYAKLKTICVNTYIKSAILTFPEDKRQLIRAASFANDLRSYNQLLFSILLSPAPSAGLATFTVHVSC